MALLKRRTNIRFQSTPSERRATRPISSSAPHPSDFNPRPPRGGRHDADGDTLTVKEISIHALREEGDSRNTQKYFCKFIIFHKFF